MEGRILQNARPSVLFLPFSSFPSPLFSNICYTYQIYRIKVLLYNPSTPLIFCKVFFFSKEHLILFAVSMLKYFSIFCFFVKVVQEENEEIKIVQM